MVISKIDQTDLLNNISAGIVCFDMMKRCKYVNKYIIDFYDQINFDYLNCLITYRESVYNDDKREDVDICNNFFNKRIENTSTMRIYSKKTKEYRWFVNKRIILKNSDREDIYMFILSDIHDKKVLEANLEKQKIKIEECDNHKAIFLANMSHELRTPLNGIIGMMTLLEDTKLNDEQDNYTSIIKECSYNLMGIINDILDYAKLDIGKILLDTKSMNLYECIETTNDIVLSKIYEKSLVYNYNIGYNIPENICGDSNRIKQVLLNILSNSIKFMEKGNIFLNIKTISKDEFDLFYKKYKSNILESNDNTLDQQQSDIVEVQDNNVYIRFDITDSGCGIDILHKDKVFEPFVQITNNLSTKIHPGTGLGLSICKELIELMGGVIWLDWSELDVGSTFSFILPVKISEISNVSNDLRIINNNVLKNANVLIVDDNLYNRISLSGIMNKWGMNPYVYSSGQEALYFSRIIRFDIGLIDICMPNMDGLSFVKKLRNQKEFDNQTIPLIALSSLGDKTEINPSYFKTNLIKPIKESKLKTICVDLLQKRVIAENKPKDDLKVLDEYVINNNLLDFKKDIRILVAEDIYINQKIITSFLNKIGFNNIIMVNDGKECLNMALCNDYDILLLDIIMPLMSGEVLIKELNKYYSDHPGHKKPYIIAVTAYCLRNDKEYYLNIGFDDYIVKPIDINELSKILNKHVENLLEN